MNLKSFFSALCPVKGFVALAAIFIVSYANAQDVELATNLGFEDPIGQVGDTASDQWIPFAGDGAVGAGTGTTAPLSGASHGEITIDGAAASFAGLQYQIDAITGGESYTFSFNARSGGADLGGVQGEFRFEFLDATGANIGDPLALNIELFPTDTYAPVSQTRVAPTNATSLRAVVALQSFGVGVDGTDSDTGMLFIDDASIQGPPIGTPPADPPPAPTPGPVMELVSNPSFEDPIGASGDVTPGQWNPFDNGGNTSGFTDTTAPLTGANHGVASIAGDDNSFAGFQQQIDNIVPGEDYTFAFSGRSEGLNLGGIDAEFRIEFLDANGTFAEDQFTNNAPVVATDTYSEFTQTHTAPAGATSLRAVIAVQSFGAGVDASNTGALFIDDTSIIGSLAAVDGLLGDVDMNGVVDFFDIQPFIDLLTNQMFQFEADIDGNGTVDFFDIQPFINILSGVGT